MTVMRRRLRDCTASRPLGFGVSVLMTLAIVACTPPSTQQSPSQAESCVTPGCPVRIVTDQTPDGPFDACILRQVGGILVADSTWGLALRSNHMVEGVKWPFGWSARREAGGIALIDRSGRIVAQEGQHVSMAGGHTRDYVFVCDDAQLEVIPG
jgi:hypothetical protein